MGLLDRLRKGSDAGAEGSPSGADDAPALEPPPIVLPSAPSEAPVRSPARSTPGSHPAYGTPARPDGERYDATQPGQTPISGVDLIMFATVSHRLRGLSADEQAAVLAGYGHSPETWNAVNTAWVARLCQMPFLYETYDAAGRSESANDHY